MKETVRHSISMMVSKSHEKLPSPYYFPFVGDYREFACGWGAAMINISVTFPVNKLIFRQMLHGIGVRTAFFQMVDEGFFSLYRGMLPPLLQKSVSISLMFGTYEMFRRPLLEAGMNSITANSIAAILAGTVEACLTPFERIQTLLQDSAYQKDFINMKHALRVVKANYGLKEYYRGLTPILLRNGPSNVVFFVLREEINNLLPTLPKTPWGLKAFKQFIIGACIGAFNSTIFYPLNVVKVHMQSQLGSPYQSVFKVFKEIYVIRNRKISHFYKGVHMNYTRSFISWGVINLAYDHLKLILFTEYEE